METLGTFLDSYLLYRDLGTDTAAWYRRIVKVFGQDVRMADFNGEAISRLLLRKQAEGRSVHYVKSLRSALVALLREARGDSPIERVRSIRFRPLDPRGWTAAQVALLLGPGCDPMTEGSRWYWVGIIQAGYYTGLDACDLWKIYRRNIADDGTLPWRRSKTGKLIVAMIPPDLLRWIDQRPQDGPIWQLRTSKEFFRRTFRGIVRRAGLVGTFKLLRKSSGSGVESILPGRGHEHLGNGRTIFERHYLARELVEQRPLMPPKLPWQPPDDDAAGQAILA